MKNTTRFFKNIVSATLLGLSLASCSNSGQGNNATTTSDTAAKPKWIDPRKGKFYSKVNVVQIPLTAIENHILGPVRSVSYKDYKISDIDSSKTLVDSGYNVYDKFGHLVDQNEYKADGTPKWKCTYKYDDSNKATLWDFKVYDGSYVVKTTFKYDGKGNKIEEDEVDSTGKPSGKTTYKYDEKGNETEEAIYGPDGKERLVTNYKYDTRGYQVEMTMKKGDGTMLRRATQEYDNNGNKLSGIDYAADTIRSRWTAIVDKKGRPGGLIYYGKSGLLLSRSRIKYDDWDNVVEDITYRPNNSMDTTAWNMATKYEYDSKGNALKEQHYKIKPGKRIPVDYTESTYVYY